MEKKIYCILVIILLISTTMLPIIGIGRSSNKLINKNDSSEIISDLSNKIELDIDISDYIVTDTLDITLQILDSNDITISCLNDTYDIYEGYTWRLYVTMVWNPPQPDKNICLWADYSTMPGGSTLKPKCNCNLGQVTSTFEWTPPIGSAGKYIIVFYSGENCNKALDYKYITVNVYPHEPEPFVTYILYTEKSYDFVIYGEITPKNNTVCLWVDMDSIPEGASFNKCHCDIGTVYSIFNWTPFINQVGTYIVTFFVGYDCGYYYNASSIKFIVITENQEPPYVTIDSPLNNTVTSNANVTLTGLITDDIGIVSVTGHHEWEGGNAITSGTIDPPVTNYPFEWAFTLREGWNKITISTSDGEELSGEDSIIIYYDSTSPVIQFIKPVQGLYLFNKKIIPLFTTIIFGKIDIDVAATDEYGIANVEFYIDNVLKDTVEEVSILYYSWTWSQFSLGKHLLKVVASDIVGNSKSNEINVWKFF